MLGGIKAFDFLFFSNTKAVEFFDNEEYGSHGNRSPAGDADEAEGLYAQLAYTAAVKETFANTVHSG